ncbi:MAG: hypothetical protein ABEH43_06685 [Flavobacteriales bacterium]
MIQKINEQKFLSVSIYMTREEFSKKGIKQKYRILKNNGEHIASRFFSSYNVHLFHLEDFYIEVWVQIGLNQIHWIEEVYDDDTLEKYVGEQWDKGLGNNE